MRIDINKVEQELIIELHGAFDSTNSTGIAEKIWREAEQHTFERVCIDLSNCLEIDALAFGGLISFRLNPMLSTKTVRIKSPSPHIKKVLEELHFECLFVID